ncbi:MAG: hypothetical protein HYZ91_02480 [Candidatus Omnitrophica bacterium]|nr:hypothetical protein [Candidatus Omnitrophota bacterium]
MASTLWGEELLLRDPRERSRSLLLYIAEGQKENPKEADLGSIRVSRSSMAASDTYFQNRLIAIYLANPTLHGKLEERDFDVEPSAFVNRLIELQLVRPTADLDAFFQVFGQKLGAYGSAVDRGDAAERQEAGRRLLDLLADAGRLGGVSAQDLSDNRVMQLIGWSNKLSASHLLLGAQMTDQDRQIRERLNVFLEAAGVRKVFQPGDLAGFEIVLERIAGVSNYQITVHTPTPGRHPSLFISVREDPLRRPHAFILSREDRGLQPDIAGLEALYAGLTLSQRIALIEELMRAVTALDEMGGRPLVYIVPEDPALPVGQSQPGVFAALLDTMLDPDVGGQWPVLGPIRNVETTPS